MSNAVKYMIVPSYLSITIVSKTSTAMMEMMVENDERKSVFRYVQNKAVYTA